MNKGGVVLVRNNVFGVIRRHGGGGGRPGGVPTFDWKEKMMLRLEKKQQKKDNRLGKMKDFGFLEEIESDVSTLNMKPIEFPSKDTYVVPTNRLEAESSANNGRTVIHMDRLFGSTKPYGMLAGRPHKEHFSHKRIFDPKTGKIALGKMRKASAEANSN